MMSSLPPRQLNVLQVIQSYWHEHGVAPSLADIAQALGLSRQTVHEHVQALRKKGYLDHVEGVGRSWKPTETAEPDSRRIPVVGRVPAGQPVFAHEDIEGWITVDDAPASVTLFALRVRGDSMTGAGILDGDLVVVRQQGAADSGDVVVALVDDEDATVKKLERQGGMVRLVAMNPAYEPIEAPGERVRVLGKVVGIRRDLAD